MKTHRVFTFVAFALALAAPAGAQEGTWDVSGEVRYLFHYEGHVFHGAQSFSLETTLDADGQYEVVLPACIPDGPPVVLSGTWTHESDRFLRAVSHVETQRHVI